LPRELFRADLVFEPPVGHEELPGSGGTHLPVLLTSARSPLAGPQACRR
jgi:hypothetical protein